MTNRAIINLGPYWTIFTRPRSDLKMLGTIQQGPGIGALGIRADGRYVQVNGDIERLLNTSRIEALLKPARERFERRSRMSGSSRYALPELSQQRRPTSFDTGIDRDRRAPISRNSLGQSSTYNSNSYGGSGNTYRAEPSGIDHRSRMGGVDSGRMSSSESFGAPSSGAGDLPSYSQRKEPYTGAAPTVVVKRKRLFETEP